MEVTEYLANVVKPMIKHPECFAVTKTVDDMGVLLLMDVHKDDMGLVVGKKGETARSIRNLVKIVGMTNSARVSVKINEPQNSG
jgi:predicted RNA-binding protein YlqC (UPF0109 family)